MTPFIPKHTGIISKSGTRKTSCLAKERIVPFVAFPIAVKKVAEHIGTPLINIQNRYILMNFIANSRYNRSSSELLKRHISAWGNSSNMNHIKDDNQS